MLSPSGSDDNPGTVDRPRRTLPKEPGSGTTYLFRGGTYGDISADWTGAVGVTLASFPGEQAILDGGSRYGSFLVLRDGSRGVTVRGLTITRYNDSYGNGSIDAYGDVGPVSILGNTFTSNGSDPVLDHHIYLGPGSAQGRIHDWLIQGNRFLNPAASSIHSFGTNGAVGITVSNNRFVGGNWGIIISEEGQRDWNIVGNTFSGIALTGVELATFATGALATVSNIRLSRNLFVSPAGAFALRVDKSFVTARSLIEDTNLYWAGGAAPILWSYPGPGHVLHVAEFRAASGMGSGSVEIDPRLDAQDIVTNSAAVGYGAS